MHAFISIYFYTIYIICCILECIKQNTVLHRYYIYVTCPEHIYIYTHIYTQLDSDMCLEHLSCIDTILVSMGIIRVAGDLWHMASFW